MNKLSDVMLNDKKIKESRYSIESVLKSMELLFCFAKPPYRFNITDMEEATGFSKNQVFRLLKSFEEFGLLRMQQDGHYVITPIIYNLVAAVETDAPLEEVALPVMEQLQQSTGETVNLGFLVEGQCTIIARRHGNQAVRLMTRLGQRTPLHAGACPKAMLAFLPEEEREKVTAMLPHYQKITSSTQTDPDLLRTEIDRIRTLGYSVSDEDFEAGAIGVGAPIFNREGKVIAAISAGGPTARVTLDMVPELAKQTIEAAQKISKLLGYIS